MSLTVFWGIVLSNMWQMVRTIASSRSLFSRAEVQQYYYIYLYIYIYNSIVWFRGTGFLNICLRNVYTTHTKIYRCPRGGHCRLGNFDVLLLWSNQTIFIRGHIYIYIYDSEYIYIYERELKNSYPIDSSRRVKFKGMQNDNIGFHDAWMQERNGRNVPLIRLGFAIV